MSDRGVSEVVKDGENGVYVENTPESMASGIVSLLKSPKKRQEYGEVSKKLASRFTERRQVRKLESLYRKISGRS